MSVGHRRSMRKKSQARRKREKLKELAHASAKEGEWNVLFFGLLVTVLAGEILYVILFFLISLFVGIVLCKREAA